MTVCRECDRPRATQQDYDSIAEGEGADLCWSAWGTACVPYDWRAEALRLRAERDALAGQLAALRAHACLHGYAALVVGDHAIAATAEEHDRRVRAWVWEEAASMVDCGYCATRSMARYRARAADERGGR